MNDEIGNRMKSYEGVYSYSLLSNLPIYARLDGRSFHTFTKGMKRPYDERLTEVFRRTTKDLIESTHAVVGYTQSDEISLAWKRVQEPAFDGKIQKLASTLSSSCTAFFLKHYCELFEVGLGTFKLPTFDCRVLNMPHEYEVANMFLWREMDATKNAITMAAHHYFGHNAIQNMNGSQKQEKLFQDANINFNDYPNSFKKGSWFRVETVEITDQALMDHIPDQFKPEKIVRNKLVEIEMKPFIKVLNRTEVIFEKAVPLYGE